MPFAIRSRGCELLHVTYVAPLVAGCQTVVTIHDLSFMAFPQLLRAGVRLMLQTLVPISARKASRVIAISHFTKRELVARLGIPDNKVVVTYLAPTPAFVAMGRSTSSGMPANIREPFILAVGNLERRKNLARLITAFHELVRTDRFGGQLVLVGKPAGDSGLLHKLAQNLGLDSRIVFTGFISESELANLYRRAIAFVYPSLYEGFGLPPLEAMACGCPVIASNVTALPEVLGDAAILVDPTSVEQILTSLRAVTQRPEVANRLRRMGPGQAARYSWSETASKTLDVYASVAHGLKRVR